MPEANSYSSLKKCDPTPRPPKNADYEIKNWETRVLAFKKSGISDRFTILLNDSHSSKKTLEELKPIKLRDMQVPLVHIGRYLVCQTVCRPTKVVSPSNLVMDLNGDIEELFFNYFRYNLDDLKWLNPGKIMVIKEPYLYYASPTKVTSIKVDSPTDVIFVDPTDYDFLKKIGAEKWYVSMSKNVERIRQMANDSFKKGDYENAVMLYDRAIRYSPELAVLYLNKSMACLRTNSFYMAYESAKLGLEKGGDPEKVLYRMGMAAYGMQQWKKAAQHFLEMLKQFPNHLDATEQLKRTTARLKEQQTGKYDFKAMCIEKENGKHEFDVADYMGPIEIAKIPGRGRGIIASKDIQKGTLLVVSKAFASSYTRDYSGPTLQCSNFNSVVLVANMLQTTRILENLQKNPQQTKELYDLYSGDFEATEDIPDGVADTARIQQISELNGFEIDVESEGGVVKAQRRHLFILPSYFNHSCLANAIYIYYGDVMALHATANIKKGEEICYAYFRPNFEYSERKTKLQNCWKFECQCKLCEIDAKDPHSLPRYKIFLEFCDFARQHKNSPQDVIEKGEMLLKKIRDTYAQRNEYQIYLALMLYALCPIYIRLQLNDKALDSLKEILRLSVDELEDELEVAHVYSMLAQFLDCAPRTVIEEATYLCLQQKALEISRCSDMEHFYMFLKQKMR